VSARRNAVDAYRREAESRNVARRYAPRRMGRRKGTQAERAVASTAHEGANVSPFESMILSMKVLGTRRGSYTPPSRRTHARHDTRDVLLGHTSARARLHESLLGPCWPLRYSYYLGLKDSDFFSTIPAKASPRARRFRSFAGVTSPVGRRRGAEPEVPWKSTTGTAQARMLHPGRHDAPVPLTGEHKHALDDALNVRVKVRPRRGDEYAL
jgi:hypothetical protein